MVRSIITALCALALLFCAGTYENYYVGKTFSTFSVYIEQTSEKLKKETASTEDARALQNFWLEKKQKLHIFIPHNEIKEIDLWLAECVAFTEEKNFEEARTKLVVLEKLSDQIPRTFLLKAENIF